jgi:hypothetical protein
MALQTKSIIGDGSRGHHRFTLTVTENSTNVATNSSSVSWKFVLSPIQNGWDWKYQNTVPVTYTITINGVNYTGNIMEYDYPDGTATVTVRSGSTTISHDSNGSKTLNFSFSVSSINVSILPGSASASGSMALTSIARCATITSAPSSFSDESESVTITYSNPAGTAVDKVEACIADSSGTVIYVPYEEISRTGTSYTFTFTDAQRNALRKAATGNTLDLRYYLRTTIGGVPYLAYKPCTMTIGNANPIVSASVVDTNDATIQLTGDRNTLVKFFSTAKATMTAEAQKGASLNTNTYVITNGRDYVLDSEATFEAVEDDVFTFEVTDSRGNVGRATATPTMVEYVKLTCNLGYDKPDGEGKMVVTCYGNFFNGSFGAMENGVTAQYRYRTQNGTFGAWKNMTVEEGDGSYLATATETGLDYRIAYEFECRAVDMLMSVSTESGLLKSIPIFHWSENDFVFEVPVTFNGGFEMPTTIGDENGDMTITGDLRLKGDGNYGNKLRFGDGDYCYISEPTDDALTIHATKITLDASSGVYLGGYAIPIVRYGTWTPSLNSSAVSSYTTQYGWYSKVNQAVTVGFCIKATCKSGYDSTTLSISGLPFTPMFSAGGGGMCSGAYVGGGNTFQCFVAETSGSVTTRVQACNNTSATNLSTSASGCNYPSGGGVITLSGTITFMSNS